MAEDEIIFENNKKNKRDRTNIVLSVLFILGFIVMSTIVILSFVNKCSTNEEDINGKCVPKCKDNEHRVGLECVYGVTYGNRNNKITLVNDNVVKMDGSHYVYVKDKNCLSRSTYLDANPPTTPAPSYTKDQLAEFPLCI